MLSRTKSRHITTSVDLNRSTIIFGLSLCAVSTAVINYEMFFYMLSALIAEFCGFFVNICVNCWLRISSKWLSDTEVSRTIRPLQNLCFCSAETDTGQFSLEFWTTVIMEVWPMHSFWSNQCWFSSIIFWWQLPSECLVQTFNKPPLGLMDPLTVRLMLSAMNFSFGFISLNKFVSEVWRIVSVQFGALCSSM